jgi:predicted aspartyl protease
MGRVVTTITLTNDLDSGMAERGAMAAADVRSLTIDDVLVDTGAGLLCLPAGVIARLGLRLLEVVAITTAVGPAEARVFRDVLLTVEGRSGTFDCIEVPDGATALLGLLPLERLGLEPDLANQRLRLLPNSGWDNYLTVL